MIRIRRAQDVYVQRPASHPGRTALGLVPARPSPTQLGRNTVMTTAVILCVPPTAVQPPPAAISRRAPVPARFPQVHQEQAMPFLESTDSLPAGTRRAADRRTMRDSPGK